MLLENRHAVIYGAGGAIGGAAARTFAREGANVHLAGRTPETLRAVAEEIAAAGGTAETAQVDAMDEEAVAAHIDKIVSRTGRIDITFNAIGMNVGDQGVPLVELSAEAYATPIRTYTHTHFVTARSAARHMIARGSGVILTLSTPMARAPAALTGSFGIAFAAVENLSRQLAVELGPHGIRVVCIRPDGIPETAATLGSHTREVWARAADRLDLPFEQLLEMVSSGSLLGRALTVDEVANVAVFLASDRASAVTGTVANVSCGSVID